MASVERGPSFVRQQKPLYVTGRRTKDYVSRATATDAAKVINGVTVYWLGALQDGVTPVNWLSYVADTSGAPQGHTYTNFHIQAQWQL